MSIRVQLFAYLSRFSPNGEEKFRLDLEPGATVASLLDKIQIPADFEKAVLVNGVRASLSRVLADEDDVFIFPPAAGG
jgi:molybdopterin converting factor small subunit